MHTACISSKAPLKQQAFQFFRDKCQLLGSLTNDSYSIYDMKEQLWIIEEYPFESYEQAESACIDKLIEMKKSK